MICLYHYMYIIMFILLQFISLHVYYYIYIITVYIITCILLCLYYYIYIDMFISLYVYYHVYIVILYIATCILICLYCHIYIAMIFIAMFFPPIIMQKACQNIYSIDYQQFINKRPIHKCLKIRHSPSNN